DRRAEPGRRGRAVVDAIRVGEADVPREGEAAEHDAHLAAALPRVVEATGLRAADHDVRDAVAGHVAHGDRRAGRITRIAPDDPQLLVELAERHVLQRL